MKYCEVVEQSQTHEGTIAWLSLSKCQKQQRVFEFVSAPKPDVDEKNWVQLRAR